MTRSNCNLLYYTFLCFVFVVSVIVVLCIPWMSLMCQTAVFHILMPFAAQNWEMNMYVCMYVCMYVKNFWISAEMVNLVNCLCYDLYCIVSFSMLHTAFVFVSGDCSIDICILFLFLCYCLVLFWFVLFLCFFCLFVFSDKFHVRLFVQQNLWTYEMIYVCMYVCMYLRRKYSALSQMTYVAAGSFMPSGKVF